ncbi:hypothetical protein [Peterkaempfera griseoplana]|uniref:hypothetical protein n=1 Tax=Peterkaempfera griseoplana TaxID=66896 RepID=UPI0012FE8BF1|nr:hypothetical protein [Peterkaempfera griseoplana]
MRQHRASEDNRQDAAHDGSAEHPDGVADPGCDALRASRGRFRDECRHGGEQYTEPEAEDAAVQTTWSWVECRRKCGESCGDQETGRRDRPAEPESG